MSQVSALRVVVDAFRRHGPTWAGPSRSPDGTLALPAGVSDEDQREALAQVLFLADQGFWAGGSDPDAPQGTAWGTSTERYLRGRYLDRADAILAAGFRHVAGTVAPAETGLQPHS